jgi:tRNA A37 threonylcarbamoyladenosine dehydratase
MPEGLTYDRQREIGLSIPQSVTIVGVGGIGSWAAIDTAMSGVENL